VRRLPGGAPSQARRTRMRVIAGRLKGMRLAVPASKVRPTYDRVRESVFAIIEPRLEGASVLDAFAGSGSLAIEAVSRGAARATLVEIDARVRATAGENVRRLGVEAECAVLKGDALKLLRSRLPGAPFDVAFVDPPYASGMQEPALRALAASGLLAEDALVVVERTTGEGLPSSVGRLELTRTERYGSTEVDFYATRSE
jgi:16S rRNA (guanine966-N2)-methyltransferase